MKTKEIKTIINALKEEHKDSKINITFFDKDINIDSMEELSYADVYFKPLELYIDKSESNKKALMIIIEAMVEYSKNHRTAEATLKEIKKTLNKYFRYY